MNIDDDAASNPEQAANPRAGKPGTGEVYSIFLNKQRVKDYVSDAAVEAVRKIDRDLPEARDIVQAIRIFVRRGTRWMVNNGIGQIIDLGSGLPTDSNTHEVAHDIDPAVRVVYVDNDPTTARQASKLAEGVPNVAFIDQDVCDREALWSKLADTGLIDFDKPIGIMASSVFHLISEVECQQVAGIGTHELVRSYVDALPSGSYLALAHLTSDVDHIDKLRHVLTYVHAVPRSDDEIRQYFDGTTLVSPHRYEQADPPYDLAWSSVWQAPQPEQSSRGGRWIKVGIGGKP